MSTSQHTIDQVRSILGRLDRSIDQAREKRLHGDTESAPTSEPAARSEEPKGRTTEPPPPAVGPARATPSRAPSPFGRAKPLRNSNPNDASTSRWSDRGAPGQND